MGVVSFLFESVPGGEHAYRALRRRLRLQRMKRQTAEEVFTDIFRRNGWSGDESVSGLGSSLAQTGVLLERLPALMRELGVHTLLDLPCGDFHWMCQVDLAGVRYIGADIVQPLVARNRERYGREGVSFECLDITRDPLPRADLLLCRDCLVHLSVRQVQAALANIAASDITWLLATTFPAHARNDDIVTGVWRPLNLQAAPFGLPAPAQLINEGCTEAGGVFSDKSMALWRVSALHR